MSLDASEQIQQGATLSASPLHKKELQEKTEFGNEFNLLGENKLNKDLNPQLADIFPETAKANKLAIDKFNAKPFSEQSAQNRINHLKKRKENGEQLTAVVFDDFYVEGGSVKPYNEATEKDIRNLVRKRLKQYDINNDGVLDKVMHGDMVGAYYEHNGVKVIPIDISGVRPEEEGKFEAEIMYEGVQKISEKTVKPDIANFSLGFSESDLSFEELGKMLNLKRLTATNIKGRRKEVLVAVENTLKEKLEGVKNNPQNNFSDKDRKEISFLRSTIFMQRISERLNQQGVTVIFSAGNDGKDSISTYLLGENTVNVGVLDELGKKAEFSADNSLVTHWRQGVFSPKMMKTGVDITGDNKADFPLSILNKNKTRSASFVGKKIDEVKGVITTEIRKAAKIIRAQYGGKIPSNQFHLIISLLDSQKLYEKKDFMSLAGIKEKQENLYVTPDFSVVMEGNSNGVLNYFLKPIEGTSFSAPSIFRD